MKQLIAIGLLLLAGSAMAQVTPVSPPGTIVGVPQNAGSSQAPSAFTPAYAAVFDVTQYGAKCDASTDDTTAINNTFAAARTASASANDIAVKIIFPAQKRCVISGTINATGFTNTANAVIVDGQGSYMGSSMSGVPIIDALGSVAMQWNNIGVIGLGGTPNYGIQIGRIGPTSSNGGGAGIIFNNFVATGAFTAGACYNFSGEEVSWNNTSCTSTGTGIGLIQDGANHWNITSAFVTETAPVDTYQSFNGNTIVGGRYKSLGGGAAIWMENASQHRYINVYGLTTGSSTSCVWLYATNSTGSTANYGVNRAVDMDIHCEGTGIAHAFLITGPGSGGANYTATPLIKSLKYRDVYVFDSSSVFAIDPAANITGVTLNHVDLDISGGNATPPFTVFDAPASYTTTGMVYVYNTSIWNGTAANSQVILDDAGAVSNSSASATFGTTTFTGQISFNAAGTYPFWGATGIYGMPSGTYMDSSSSGTQTGDWDVWSINTPTLAASSATTYSGHIATFRCNGAPVAGTNVTFSGTVYCIDSEGPVRFASTLSVNSTTSLNLGVTAGGASVNLNASSNFNVNIGTGTSSGITTIGGGSGTITVVDPIGINVNQNNVTNINTGTSTGTVTIGGGSNSVAITDGTLKALTSFQGQGTYAAWGTAGIYNSPAETYTDSSSTGTVATETGFWTFNAPTLSASNTGVTYSGTVATIDCVGVPIAGTNVTISSTPFCINSDGPVRFASTLSVNGVGSFNGGVTMGGGTINLNVSNAAQTTNIGTGTTTGTVNIGSSTDNLILTMGGATSKISFPNLMIAGNVPTIGGGFGTGAAVTHNNGSASFSVNIGTGGTASTGTITLNGTASNGWACHAEDVTTPASNWVRQSGSTTTSASFTNYSPIAGSTATAWTASDVLEITCLAN